MFDIENVDKFLTNTAMAYSEFLMKTTQKDEPIVRAGFYQAVLTAVTENPLENMIYQGYLEYKLRKLVKAYRQEAKIELLILMQM